MDRAAARIYRSLGRLQEAIECHERALEIHRELGDRWREAHALTRSGEDLFDLRRFDEAVEALEEALTIHQEAGDLQGRAWAYHHLGNVHYECRRFDQAIGHYRHALEIRREAAFHYGAGITLDVLALALEGAGQLDAARECLREAFTILTDLGAPEADKIRARLDHLGQ